MKQIYIIIVLVFTCCSTLHDQSLKISSKYNDINITQREYEKFARNHASVIIKKKSTNDTELNMYHGELGNNDLYITGIIIKNASHYFLAIISQYNETTGYSYYMLNLKKNTIDVYVYSNMQTSNLILYKRPDFSTEKDEISGYVTEELTVIDVHGLWLRVRFIHDNQEYLGWLPYRSYCANPYSTCS